MKISSILLKRKTWTCFKTAVTLKRCRVLPKTRQLEMSPIAEGWHPDAWDGFSLWGPFVISPSLAFTGTALGLTHVPEGQLLQDPPSSWDRMNSIFHFKQKTGLIWQATNHSVLKRRRRRELYLTKTMSPGEQAQRGSSHFPNRKSQVLFFVWTESQFLAWLVCSCRLPGPSGLLWWWCKMVPSIADGG